MPRPATAWREAAVDAAAAALFPAIAIVAPLNDVVFRNVRDLQYHPDLVQVFFTAAGLLWVAGFAAIRLLPASTAVRVCLVLPWAFLLMDVSVGVLGQHLPFLATVLLDVVIVTILLLAGWRASFRSVRRVAAAAGLVLIVHGVTRHALEARDLSTDLVVGANRAPAAAAARPDADAPGNVYHLLFDAYQSESFADSTRADAASRFPGFTYYTRFNTNFPRTSSSEPALIHGRLPAPGLSIEQWPHRALSEGFWSRLASARRSLWIYPYGRWLCPAEAAKCVSAADLARDVGAETTRDATIDLWAWRLMPPSLRQWLTRRAQGRRATEASIAFSVTQFVRTVRGGEAEPDAPTTSALPLQYFNLRQFDELLADEERRPTRGQYVYYHAMIPHHDHIMNERCEVVEPTWDEKGYWGHVACANLMIDRLIQTLRRLGRFEDSLIVIHADHGAPEFLVSPGTFGRPDDFGLDERARLYQPVDTTYHDAAEFERRITSGDSAAWRSIAVEILSSGLLLVKRPGSREYAEDDRPVQLVDIAPTILDHFNLDTHPYAGVPLRDVPRVREQTFFAHSRDFDGKLSKYRLTPAGWVFDEDLPVISSLDD